MTGRARFRPLAIKDLIAIADWLATEAQSRAVGQEFVARLRQRCHAIAALPGTLGRARDDLGSGIRSLAWRNYVILFRYFDGELQVVRIIHGQRDLPAMLAPNPEAPNQEA